MMCAKIWTFIWEKAMNRLSDSISRKGTYSTQWDYIEDRFGTNDILPFSISDMDFPIPIELTKVIKKRANHPIWGYSRWCNEEYLNAIANWYKKRFETTIVKDWIIYSPSVMYSISKCIEIKSNEHDRILIFTPAYNGFYDVIKNSNRKIVESQLVYENNAYRVNWEDFENKLSTVKILLFCNPQNPIGKVWSEEELCKITALCIKRNVMIISDDIHMDIVFESNFNPMLKIQPLYKNLVVISSISKTFNVPALTGSYILIPEKALRDEFQRITRYRDFVNSPSILNVLATIEAYDNCEYWVDSLNTYIVQNKRLVNIYLKEKIPKLQMTESEACYFSWIDFSNLKISDEKFQNVLVNYGKIGIMPGTTYGLGGKNFLRLNIGCPESKLIEGLHRLRKTTLKVLESEGNHE